MIFIENLSKILLTLMRLADRVIKAVFWSVYYSPLIYSSKTAIIFFLSLHINPAYPYTRITVPARELGTVIITQNSSLGDYNSSFKRACFA
jgi:hypothetical protein